MRQHRQQRSPSKSIVRYQRQATWSKKPLGALRDQLLRRRKKDKMPINKR